MKLYAPLALALLTVAAQAQSKPKAQLDDWSAVANLKHHPILYIEATHSYTGPVRCQLDHIEGTKIFCAHRLFAPPGPVFDQADIRFVSREYTSRARKIVIVVLLAVDVAALASGGLVAVSAVGLLDTVVLVALLQQPSPRKLIYEMPQPPTPSPASIP